MQKKWNCKCSWAIFTGATYDYFSLIAEHYFLSICGLLFTCICAKCWPHTHILPHTLTHSDHVVAPQMRIKLADNGTWARSLNCLGVTVSTMRCGCGAPVYDVMVWKIFGCSPHSRDNTNSCSIVPLRGHCGACRHAGNFCAIAFLTFSSGH